MCADATWQCAADLRLDRLNSASGRGLASEIAELRGRRLDDLASKAIYGSQTDALLACLENRRAIRDLSLSLLSKSGAVRNYLLNAAPRLDAQGSFRGYIGAVRACDDVPFAEYRC